MHPSKVTAAQIEKDCPTEVEALGYRIAAHLQKVRDYEAKAHEKAGVELRKADDNWTTVTQLLAEAKVKCDAGGFKAFKERFCPDLSRSRIYELLQIGSGKKTLEESRAAKRKSVAKSRKKVSATNDVADKAEFEDWLKAQDKAQKASAFALNEFTVAGRKWLPKVTEQSHQYKARRLTDKMTEPPKAEAAEQSSGLGSVIEREWLEAERAFEALAAHTVQQIAQVIRPEKIALVKEIAERFTAVVAKLADRSGDIAGAIVNGSGHAIPDNLDIPEFLRRGDGRRA
jgi:hypothetical protein